jgi:predicted metalloprotease
LAGCAGFGSTPPTAVPSASSFATAAVVAPKSLRSAKECSALPARAAQVKCLLPLAEVLLAQAYAPVVESRGITFTRPTVITESGGVETKCGRLDRTAYCPVDGVIVLPVDKLATLGDRAARDVKWSDQVMTYFRSALTEEQLQHGGAYGPVMALAHEYGHHVQQLLGYVSTNTAAMTEQPKRASELSSELELMADCFAGWIAGTVDAANAFEVEPIDQWAAVTALAEVGDDFVSESRGTPAEEVAAQTFDHGAANERANAWVSGVGVGLDGGEPYEKCLVVARDLIAGRQQKSPSPSA